MINDATTDLINPPRFTLGKDGPADFDREIIAEHTRKHGELAPLKLEMPPRAAFDTALDVAKAQGWKIAGTDADAGLIEAVATTRILRFKDDIVVRVRAEDGGSRIDVRSKSRVGRDDFGANAKRIKTYLDALASR